MDAEQTPRVLFAPTGANYRSLNTDFTSQMHETDVLKPVFHRQKNQTTQQTQTNKTKTNKNPQTNKSISGTWVSTLSLHRQVYFPFPPFANTAAFAGV